MNSSLASYPIRALPSEERPRERFLKNGEESLSAIELLAILLGSGIKGVSVLRLAQEILAHFGTMANIAEVSIQELLAIKGLGKAKAIQIKAALALRKRMEKRGGAERAQISSLREAYLYLRKSLENKNQEQFIALLLDAKGCVLQQTTIAIGTLSAAIIHPREVFYPAIRHKRLSTNRDQDALLLNSSRNPQKISAIFTNMAEIFCGFLEEFRHANHPIEVCGQSLRPPR